MRANISLFRFGPMSLGRVLLLSKEICPKLRDSSLRLWMASAGWRPPAPKFCS
jgi:hypothetical protein